MGKHLADSDIKLAINSVERSDAPVTVARVRQFLLAEHGTSGSTDRLLRHIQEARRCGKEADVQMLRLCCEQQQSELVELKLSLAAAQIEKKDLQRKLEISEERGRADQVRWMMELDTLRQQGKKHTELTLQLQQANSSILKLHQKVRDLELKV